MENTKVKNNKTNPVKTNINEMNTSKAYNIRQRQSSDEHETSIDENYETEPQIKKRRTNQNGASKNQKILNGSKKVMDAEKKNVNTKHCIQEKPKKVTTIAFKPGQVHEYFTRYNCLSDIVKEIYLNVVSDANNEWFKTSEARFPTREEMLQDPFEVCENNDKDDDESFMEDCHESIYDDSDNVKDQRSVKFSNISIMRSEYSNLHLTRCSSVQIEESFLDQVENLSTRNSTYNGIRFVYGNKRKSEECGTNKKTKINTDKADEIEEVKLEVYKLDSDYLSNISFTPLNSDTRRNVDVYEAERMRVHRNMNKKFSNDTYCDVISKDNTKTYYEPAKRACTTTLDNTNTQKSFQQSYKLEVTGAEKQNPKPSTSRMTNCHVQKSFEVTSMHDNRLKKSYHYYERDTFYKRDAYDDTKIAKRVALEKEKNAITERFFKNLAAYKKTEEYLNMECGQYSLVKKVEKPLTKVEPIKTVKKNAVDTEAYPFMRICDIEHPKTALKPIELEVRKSTIHGMGVYAKQKIYKDQLIGEYSGELIGKGVSDKREILYKKAGIKDIYMFGMTEDHIIDATRFGSILRFVNHSCHANSYAEIKKFGSDAYRVYFAADRLIEPGEELSIDYQMKKDENEDRIQCFCNASNCRKYIDQ